MDDIYNHGIVVVRQFVRGTSKHARWTATTNQSRGRKDTIDSVLRIRTQKSDVRQLLLSVVAVA